MEIRTIDIELIKSNPYRDFKLKPYDQKHLSDIEQAIKTDMRAGMSNQEICKKYSISSANACGYRKRI